MFNDKENEQLKTAFRTKLEMACGNNGRRWDQATEIYVLNAVRKLIAEQDCPEYSEIFTPLYFHAPKPAQPLHWTEIDNQPLHWTEI